MIITIALPLFAIPVYDILEINAQAIYTLFKRNRNYLIHIG